MDSFWTRNYSNLWTKRIRDRERSGQDSGIVPTSEKEKSQCLNMEIKEDHVDFF